MNVLNPGVIDQTVAYTGVCRLAGEKLPQDCLRLVIDSRHGAGALHFSAASMASRLRGPSFYCDAFPVLKK